MSTQVMTPYPSAAPFAPHEATNPCRKGVQGAEFSPLNLALGRVCLSSAITPPHSHPFHNQTIRIVVHHVYYHAFEKYSQSVCTSLKVATSVPLDHTVMSCQKAPEWLRPTCTRRSRRVAREDQGVCSYVNLCFEILHCLTLSSSPRDTRRCCCKDRP